MLAPHQCDELLEETPDGIGAMPANHVGRDLVAHQIGKHGRMAAAGLHPCSYRGADLVLDRGAVEEGDVLRPRQADQHLEPGGVSPVQQPDRRHGEDAQRVDAGARHQREIALDDVALGKLRAVAAFGERAVGDALDEMLHIAGEEEFALHPDWGGNGGLARQQRLQRRRLDRDALAFERAHVGKILGFRLGEGVKLGGFRTGR